ncbi:hypothetical protein D3C87_104830 [compost metagenome]
MRKILHLLTFSLLFSGCATHTADKNNFKNYNDFGVLAFFSQNMPIQFNAFSARNSKTVSADIGSWDIAAVLTAELESQLKGMNKDLKKVTVDPVKVKTELDEARNLNAVYLGDRYQILDQYLLTEAGTQGAKYLFILHPVSLETFPQHKGGFGFICNSSKNSKGELEGYALYRTELWNVKTQSVDRRITITPAEMSFKTGKSCQETKNISPDKLAALYKEDFMSLAKNSITLMLQKASAPIDNR